MLPVEPLALFATSRALLAVTSILEIWAEKPSAVDFASAADWDAVVILSDNPSAIFEASFACVAAWALRAISQFKPRGGLTFWLQCFMYLSFILIKK